MISPFTPPGTKVVCIEKPRHLKGPGHAKDIVDVGGIFTVQDMVAREEISPGGVGVRLQEVGNAIYSRCFFRRLDHFDHLLNVHSSAPVDNKERV